MWFSEALSSSEEEGYHYGNDAYGEPEYEQDFDEVYFDAMTDGRLGSYDEFRENGGDSDYIDNWAGR